MKKLKKYNQFIDESVKLNIEPPKKDSKFEFLVEICKKANYEQTNHFYVKDLIEIGTIGEHKLYLNYLSLNEYSNDLSYWFVYNETEDDLYGTSWESGVIWEENGFLQISDFLKLYPNFIDIIYNEIKSYNDLDKWIEHIKNVGITRRKYTRLAVQRKEITWEERLEWVRNNIESDRLLNRYSKPYDEKILKNMIELGEEKWKEKTKIENDYMKNLMDEIEMEEKIKI